MSKTQIPEPTQAQLNSAALRAMLDLKKLANSHSPFPVLRAPFALRTKTGLWTCVGGEAVTLAVKADLGAPLLEVNSKFARTMSHCLNQTGRYTYVPENIEDLKIEMQDAASDIVPDGMRMTVASGGWNYDPQKILAAIDALGAPDSRVETGHFTLPGKIDKVANPLIWCFTGTVARHEWRMFVVPFDPQDRVTGGAK